MKFSPRKQEPASADSVTITIGIKQKRSHRIITFEERLRLIDHINRTENFRLSARTLGISESTAKTIYYKYMRTGIIVKKHDSKKKKVVRKSSNSKALKHDLTLGMDSDSKVGVLMSENSSVRDDKSDSVQRTERVTF